MFINSNQNWGATTMALIKMSIGVRTTMTIGEKSRLSTLPLVALLPLRIVANSYNPLLAASPCALLSALADRQTYISLCVSGTKLVAPQVWSKGIATIQPSNPIEAPELALSKCAD